MNKRPQPNEFKRLLRGPDRDGDFPSLQDQALEDREIFQGDGSTGNITYSIGAPSFATPAFTFGTSNSAGTATTAVRSDAQLALFDTTVPATQAFGDAAATGSAAVAARRDHKHGMPASPTTSFAAPAFVFSTSNADGVASTAVRSDAQIALFDATVPSTQAIGDSASAGVAAVAARRDHKHAMPAFASPTIVLGTAAATGAAATLVRSDATIAAFDATAPVTQAFGDAAATGSAAFAARRDHKHGMPANPVSYAGTGDLADVAAAEGAGAASTVPRGDHVHAHGSGYLPNAHHNRSHDHSNASDGQTLAPTSVAATSFLSAAGSVRIGNAGSFQARNAADSSYYPLISGNASDQIVLGVGADIAASGRILLSNFGTVSATGLWAGSGAPSNVNGSNGEYYFRTDGGVGTHIYFKTAGAWVGLV